MNETIKKHCVAVYDMLQSEAEMEDGVLKWRGPISVKVMALGIPSGYYGRVMNQLEFMGCLTRKGRGGFNAKSEIWLHRSPEQVGEWQEFPQKDLTDLPDYAMLAQTVKNVNDLIGGLDIREAFRTLDARVSQLERKFTKYIDTRGEN